MTLAAGTFTFTPTANYAGPATFTYTVYDGNGGTATGTVNITVDPVNDAPVAVADAFTINEDTALVIPRGSLTANDTDIDGGALSVTSVQGALNGTVTLAAGTITFTPTANYSGRPPSPTPCLTATAAPTPATVTITVNPVNDAPVAVADAFTINEDTALVIAADSLPPTTPTSMAARSASPASRTRPTARCPSPPAPSCSPRRPTTTDRPTFTYTVSDGNGGTATGTVNITVTRSTTPRSRSPTPSRSTRTPRS